MSPHLKKVGILGGTFNPVHFGHLRAAEEVRERLSMDSVMFIPSKYPPLKSKMIAPAGDRYEMLKRALRGNRFFRLSDIEYRMRGKSYTVKTLMELKKYNPEFIFSFILGIDAFLDIPNWRQPEELMGLASFVLVSRPGMQFMEIRKSPFLNIRQDVFRALDAGDTDLHIAPLTESTDIALLRITPIGISSTELRKRVREGKSIKYLLPARVKSYIISRRLYISGK